MIFLLLACSSALAADITDFIGVWDLTSLESNGEVQNPKRFGFTIKLTLTEDNLFSMIRNNVNTEGEWAFDQNKLNLMVDQSLESYSYSFEDENLILNKDEVLFIFSPEDIGENQNPEEASDAEISAEDDNTISQRSGGVITGTQCSKYPAYLTKGDMAEIINVQSVPIYEDDLKTIRTYAFPGKTFTINSQPYCKGGVNYYYVNFNGWEGLLQETLNDLYVMQKANTGE